MTNLLKIPAWADDQYIYAVVETPRGSSCKLDFDPALRVFTLAKPLMTGLTYPYDWGFIPSTKAEDGDPLDVLVIHDAKTYSGVVLRCNPSGSSRSSRSPRARRKGTTVCSRCPTAPLSRPICRTSATFRSGHGRSWNSSSGPQTHSRTRNSNSSAGIV